MKKLLSLFFSALILALLYWRIDFVHLAAIVKGSDISWLTVSLLMNIPLVLATSWRLRELMPVNAKIRMAEANRLILMASVLNMVLPSKMGDVAKAYFMTERGHMKGSLSLALVIFEKSCDMLSLLLWCAGALLFFPDKSPLFWMITIAIAGSFVFGATALCSGRFARLFFIVGSWITPGRFKGKLDSLRSSWEEMQRYFWQDKGRFLVISGGSVFIWFLHLLQIWFFILTLNSSVPFRANLALSPLAILAGLVPLTFAGVGTRDAAIVMLYRPYMDAATALALGALCTSRYLVPALMGLPFLNEYWQKPFLKGKGPLAQGTAPRESRNVD
jgi:uncharacterized protein (TIRG00374 family)